MTWIINFLALLTFSHVSCCIIPGSLAGMRPASRKWHQHFSHSISICQIFSFSNRPFVDFQRARDLVTMRARPHFDPGRKVCELQRNSISFFWLSCWITLSIVFVFINALSCTLLSFPLVPFTIHSHHCRCGMMRRLEWKVRLNIPVTA